MSSNDLALDYLSTMNDSSDGSSVDIPKEWFEDVIPIIDNNDKEIDNNYGIPKQQTMKETGLFEGNAFCSHSDLEAQILHWGKNIGIVDLCTQTSRKLKDNLGHSEYIKQNFPYEYYVFKCSQRSHKGCDCGFRLRYAFSSKLKKIVITKIFKPHGALHPETCNGLASLQSTRFVTSVKDLTEEEKMFLREIAPERPNLIRLKSTMNRLFPHRLFDRFLLRRELTKGLNEYLGSDKDSATKFMQYGDELILGGGIFKKKACAGSLRFTTIHMQHRLERDLNDVYGKRFVSIDTTFNISCHDMKVMPFVAVDCLCKNCPVGYTFMEVENAQDIVDGFRALNIGTKGMHVGCDNGTAIICALNELKMHPAHDGWHYHRSGKLAARNMGPLRNAFLADLYKVIYHDFHDDEDLDDYLKTMMRTYNINEKMNSFLIGEIIGDTTCCLTFLITYSYHLSYYLLTC